MAGLCKDVADFYGKWGKYADPVSNSAQKAIVCRNHASDQNKLRCSELSILRRVSSLARESAVQFGSSAAASGAYDG